jgi:hypothetical protein
MEGSQERKTPKEICYKRSFSKFGIYFVAVERKLYFGISKAKICFVTTWGGVKNVGY